MSDTMLSRSGRTDPDGKKTSRIDVPVSEELEAEIITLATLNRMSKAEWVRWAIEKVIHGELGQIRRLNSRAHDVDGSNIR